MTKITSIANMIEPVINNGYWDGQPIWRPKTAGELLFEEIEKNKLENNQKQSNGRETN